jgi:CheY-like chemotaxis protein
MNNTGGSSSDKTARILVCDDDALMGRVIGDTLVSSFACEVAITRNAFDAVSNLKRGDYDALVTDILLPRMDGIELILEAKKIENPPKIVAYSGGGALGRFSKGPSFLEVAKALGADWAFPRQDITTALIDLAMRGCLARSTTQQESSTES